MWREKNTEKGKGDRENREKEVEIGENRAPTGGVSAEIGGGEEEQERAALPFQKCLSCRVDFVLFVTGSRNAEQRMPSRGQPFHECAAEQSLKKDMITDNRRGIFLDPKKKKSRSRRPGADTGVVPLFAIHGTPMVCTSVCLAQLHQLHTHREPWLDCCSLSPQLRRLSGKLSCSMGRYHEYELFPQRCA